MSPRFLFTSVLAHAATLGLLFTVRFAGPASLLLRKHSVTLMAPISQPTRLTPKPQARPLRPFRPVLPPAPEAAPKIVLEVPPSPDLETPKSPLPPPAVPRAPVSPAPLSTGSFVAAQAKTTEPAPVDIVKSAGFSGIEAAGPRPLPAARLATGAFNSAALTEQAPKRTPVSVAALFSDASTTMRASAARPASAVKSQFGDASAGMQVVAAPTKAQVQFTPVEILSKPRPVYTAEARRLRIEGEVLVEMLFEAAGTVRVTRVLRGLGHGLDENAITAAREIVFRPARRQGADIDSPAIVHIVFQLAY